MRSRPPSHQQTTFANDGVVGFYRSSAGLHVKALDRTVLDELQSFSAPSLSNGIETFDVRPRNEGFADGTVRCMFPDLGARIGYAATAEMRSAEDGIGYRRRPSGSTSSSCPSRGSWSSRTSTTRRAWAATGER
jgi:hypothetical protein